MSAHRAAEEKAIASRAGAGARSAATATAAGDASSPPPFTNHHRAHEATRRWVLAGLAGLAMGMLVSFTGMLNLLPAPIESIAVFVFGWMVFAGLAPRALMRELEHDDRPAIARLAAHAQAVADGDRTVGLRELALDRDDELGALSRAVHALATVAHQHRQQTRLMHRRLGHHVQRETHKATFHLQREAMTDPLTGLGNRRALRRHVEAVITRHGAHAPVTVMLVDLDRFKQINDALGHATGDRCLTFLADILRSCLRRRDALIRMGGDEFAVIMPNSTLEGAQPAAQRMIALFRQIPWPHASLARPTLSIGMAHGAAGELLDDAALLARADAALYEAKRGGRCRIVVSAGE
jgi:diguanylate cyclase (GGDEF)-like protein